MVTGIFAFIATFILGIVLYPIYINYLNSMSAKQEVSEYALDEFKAKAKTATFGGVLFVLIPIVVVIILSIRSLSLPILSILFVYAAYGALGFVDDYKIIKEGRNDGLKASTKFLVQCAIGLIVYIFYINYGGTSVINIPILNIDLDLGLFYMPFVIIMFSAYSNAVNLTDGMDGLATGTSIIAFAALSIIAFIQGRMDIFMILMAVMGVLFAFLFFNYKPAKIFMGDVGSLALGAMFAIISLYLNVEVLSVVIGGVFVYETLCVVIQQISWRTRRKRVFKYTPIHYSFTLNGWEELSVVHFFWLLGLIFAVLGLIIGVVL